MQQIFQFFSHLPEFLQSGGYWLLALIIILEGLPLIGSIFPGHLAIILAGFFAKLGILHVGWVLVVAIIAAVLGDVIGYYCGRRYGHAALQKYSPYFFFSNDYIEKAKRIVENHVGKTVVFAKFSPLTRSLMPFLVGASGVHIRTFWFYNLLGGALWIVSSVLIGYIFGVSYYVVVEYFGILMFAALVSSLLILWTYRVVNIRFHIFKKYELFMLGLNVISLWALLKTIQDGFSATSFMANFDITVNLFMAEHVNVIWKIVAEWTSMILNLQLLHLAGIIIGAIFLMKGKWRRGALMLISITSASVGASILASLFMRSRPLNALHLLPNPSFPSLHAALAAALFVAVMYIFAPRIHFWVKREAFIVLCVALTAIVGLSLVTLNLHWASDVIAGWSLGIFVASGSVLLVRYVGALLLKSK